MRRRLLIGRRDVNFNLNLKVVKYRLLSNEIDIIHVFVPLTQMVFLIGHGVKQGGILSPLLFNVGLYVDNLSLPLHSQSICCNVSGTVVNHTLYADRRHRFVCSLCEWLAKP